MAIVSTNWGWRANGRGLPQEQERAVLRALEEAGLPRLPVLAELDFGHTDPIATLPCGAVAQIDCSLARLTILEPGVTDIHA